MDTKIKKLVETDRNLKIEKPTVLFSPEGMDHTKSLRIKSIKLTDECTRIDFIYLSSKVWDNGGWISMESESYIQPVGSTTKYKLIRSVGIPIAPRKYYFKQQGQYHTYTLYFPALPKNTACIDIIEKLAPGNFFNFYNVDYSTWMTVPHAIDIARNDN
jgi:hypothetical protein